MDKNPTACILWILICLSQIFFSFLFLLLSLTSLCCLCFVDHVYCCHLVSGWDWRPLDCQETANAQSHLIKQILTADYNTEHFCAGISMTILLTSPAVIVFIVHFVLNFLLTINHFFYISVFIYYTNHTRILVHFQLIFFSLFSSFF